MNNQQNQSGNPMSGNDARNQNTGATPGSAGLAGPETSGMAGASRKTGTTDDPTRIGDNQPAATPQPTNKQTAHEADNSGNVLDKALEGGKKWIEDSGVLNSANQLPQSVKDWSSRAATRVGDLTTTQKIVGGALLAVGIGYLATRKGKSEKPESRKDRQGSSYGRRSSYGYQAPDASNSRRSSVGSGRTDSGSPYGNSGSRYGSSSNAISGFDAPVSGGDSGARTSEGSSWSKTDDSRSGK